MNSLLPSEPIFSIVTPVFNTNPKVLEETIESVFAQSFKSWELLLVDDCSTDADVSRILALAVEDPRVRVTRTETNSGISVASNLGADLARGAFLVLLDHDDLLARDALFAMNAALEANPESDFLYSDEDHVTSDSTRCYGVFYKPGWSPERMRSQMYTCHLTVVRKSLFWQIGGFRPEFDGSQDYDLTLRLSEQTQNIVHVPRVLYHWRAVPESASSAVDAKPWANDAAVRALEDHARRIGFDAKVRTIQPGLYDMQRERKHSLVSLVIPTVGTDAMVYGSRVVFVTSFVESVLRNSSYRDFEIVCVLDPKTPDSVVSALQTTAVRDPRLKLVWIDSSEKEFNYARWINVGALQATGDVLVLLNDDMEVKQSDWLERLLEFFVEPDVGAVGAMLLLENGLVQHAGIVCNGSGAHHFAHRRRITEEYDSCALRIAREVSAVTGACLAVRRDTYFEVGGMSEIFPRSFNDVDFCFKVRATGRRIIWTPHSVLYHFESKSRDPKVEAFEFHQLFDRWQMQMKSDPYFNPNLAESNTGSMLAY